MAKVNKYIICHSPLSYYLQRDSSIVASYSLRNLDMIRGLEERHKFISNNYKELINDSYKSIFNGVTQHYEILSKMKYLDKDFQYRIQLRGSILYRNDEIEAAFKGDKVLTKRLKNFCRGYKWYKSYMFCHKVNLRLSNKNSRGLKRTELQL